MSALPPGWYPDPGRSPRLRYWDGTRWTDRTADEADEAVSVTARRHSRERIAVLAGVVLVLGAVVAWRFFPWPNVARERAVNAVSVGVSVEGVPITEEQSVCVVDEAHRLGVPFVPMERTWEMTPGDDKRMQRAFAICRIEGAELEKRDRQRGKK